MKELEDWTINDIKELKFRKLLENQEIKKLYIDIMNKIIDAVNKNESQILIKNTINKKTLQSVIQILDYKGFTIYGNFIQW